VFNLRSGSTNTHNAMQHVVYCIVTPHIKCSHKTSDRTMKGTFNINGSNAISALPYMLDKRRVKY